MYLEFVYHKQFSIAKNSAIPKQTKHLIGNNQNMYVYGIRFLTPSSVPAMTQNSHTLKLFQSFIVFDLLEAIFITVLKIFIFFQLLRKTVACVVALGYTVNMPFIMFYLLFCFLDISIQILFLTYYRKFLYFVQL